MSNDTTTVADTPAAEPAGSGGGPWTRFVRACRALVEVPAGTPWHRSPKVALGLSVAVVVGTLIIGFLGPSVLTLKLGPRETLMPSWYLPGSVLKPDPWLVSILGWTVVLLGGISAWISLRALAVGWAPRVKHLWIYGVVINLITITVPPMTSADVLMYAAYGRLSKLGVDPYVISPAEHFRMRWDPVLFWTEGPWHDTVNVYGPLLVFFQWLGNVLGGDNMHDIVFWLQLFYCLFFVAACSVIVWLARGNAVLQRRAVLWTLANPIMIWAVVTGAHNEAVSLFFAVAAFAFMRKHPFVAGLLVGIACTGKATTGLYGLAMGWAYRRQPKKLLLMVLGAAIPNVIAYIVFYPKALELASQNASYVAGSSWIAPLRRLIAPFLESETTQLVVAVLGWGSAVMIGWMLSRVLPWRALPGLPEGSDPERDPLTIAVRTTIIIGAAWTITSAYSLAWYDLMYFLPLALIGATKLDLIALWRVTVLNLAYVLGRVLNYPPLLKISAMRIREVGSTTVAIGILVAVILWWHEHGLKAGSHTKAAHAGDETDEPAVRSS